MQDDELLERLFGTLDKIGQLDRLEFACGVESFTLLKTAALLFAEGHRRAADLVCDRFDVDRDYAETLARRVGPPPGERTWKEGESDGS